MNRLIPLALSLIVAFSAVTPGALAKTAAPAKAPAQTQPVKPKTKATGPATTKKEEKAEKPSAAEIDASIASATKVDSLTLLQNPQAYLNKKVTFTGTFNRFADIALDYKKAFRDSRDYVTFFVLRPDTSATSTIPLSELKLFFPRKKSSEVLDVESGDVIQVVGTQFSTALGEPWIDVEHIKILQKTPHPERKHNTPEF
jgi:lysyl-tRNA synthetase class II